MRSSQAKKRPIVPDEKYQSEVVTVFTHKVMTRGKKSLAKRLIYRALARVEQVAGKPALEVFEEALKNAGPLVEVRPRRVGGANYLVPMEVDRARRLTLAMRWIRDAAREKQGKSFDIFLAEELLSAAKGEGSAVKKKDDAHRQAEANRAFAHFARF